VMTCGRDLLVLNLAHALVLGILVIVIQVHVQVAMLDFMVGNVNTSVVTTVSVEHVIRTQAIACVNQIQMEIFA